ncbi:hypothetical protein N0V90_005319 [Kalmusia sp. IMI 367209]|nr:hypothetical protein N0V90_005319 [Kalmusia sp. IMI 367209]
MVTITAYHLPETRLIPNSPQPLLYYKGLLTESERRPENIDQRFTQQHWKTQWIFRYATIRFGVADLDDDLYKNTWGGAYEPGGLKLEVQAGDALIIPAGVAHKTYNTSPADAFSLLTPGQGRGLQTDNVYEALSRVKLSGFTMMGAYPGNCSDWDFSRGGEDLNNFQASWEVARPDFDPFLGTDKEGICGKWNAMPRSNRKNPYARI